MNEMGRRAPGGGEEEGLRQVQVPEGVQGLPPGGRVRAGVGHGELARAVQGRSRSGRRGWCSGPSSCPCWERQALDPGAGGEGGLQVRGREREVREVEGRKGVLLIALGLTDHGVRAVLDVVLTREEE